jgi:glycine cleavage system H protein
MAELRYTKSHEWCSLDGEIAACGLSKHATDELGDLTYLDLQVGVGDTVEAGQGFGEIESVKATSELFCPVGGTIEAINERWSDANELPNLSGAPESAEGWLIKIKVADPAQVEGLMDGDAYREHAG